MPSQAPTTSSSSGVSRPRRFAPGLLLTLATLVMSIAVFRESKFGIQIARLIQSARDDTRKAVNDDAGGADTEKNLFSLEAATEICQNENTANTTSIRLKKRKMDPDIFLHMHIGKGGGGTVNQVMLEQWGYRHNQCGLSGLSCTQEYANEFEDRLIFMPIRDPIDRFISAFYWRLLVTCDFQNNETRNVTNPDLGLSMSLAVKYPTQWCKPPAEGEREMYQVYDNNPKVLLQRLCGLSNPDNDDDMPAKEMSIDTSSQALVDINRIRHIKDSRIVDWVGDSLNRTYFDWRANVDRFFPIVLEKEYDLPTMVNEAIVESYSTLPKAYGDEPLDEFRQRQASVLCKKTNNEDETVEISQHTSSQQGAGHKGVEKVALNRQEEQCLALYYKDDYMILDELRNKACKSKMCRQAIGSILQRRAGYIDAMRSWT